MKTSPKHILSLAGLLLLAVPFLQAADAPAAGDKANRQERRQGGPGAMMDRAAKELGLTADQEAKWKEIGKQEREALKPLRDDTALSQEDRRAKVMEINQGFANQRRALLTPDQAAKFDELRGKMRERGGDRGPNKPKNN